jgi:hypothetical protein
MALTRNDSIPTFQCCHSNVPIEHAGKVTNMPTQCKFRKKNRQALFFNISRFTSSTYWGGTWPSSQRGALAWRRSRVRALAVAVSLLFVLTCCWLREVSDRPSWSTVCCDIRVTHSAQLLEPPSRAGFEISKLYYNYDCLFHLFISSYFFFHHWRRWPMTATSYTVIIDYWSETKRHTTCNFFFLFETNMH